MRPIATPRLTLEPQVAAHAPAMFAVLSDPAIYEFENEPPASQAWLQQRFARLESRVSADGRQRWLNWIVRLGGANPIGYVQATVLDGDRALVAYELGSAYWGYGYGQEAVGAMLGELQTGYGTKTFVAVFKERNFRSRRLLQGLGFTALPPEGRAHYGLLPDEDAMVREARPA